MQNNLNLPDFLLELKQSDIGICIKDIVRRKFIKLTPEEWVRQHFINYLVQYLNYPKTRIRTEMGMNYSQKHKRADIIVFDHLGSPFIIVECKSFKININQNTLLQISAYQSVLSAQYLVLTNGLIHYYYKISSGQIISINELPTHCEDTF